MNFRISNQHTSNTQTYRPFSSPTVTTEKYTFKTVKLPGQSINQYITRARRNILLQKLHFYDCNLLVRIEVLWRQKSERKMLTSNWLFVQASQFTQL